MGYPTIRCDFKYPPPPNNQDFCIQLTQSIRVGIVIKRNGRAGGGGGGGELVGGGGYCGFRGLESEREEPISLCLSFSRQMPFESF